MPEFDKKDELTQSEENNISFENDTPANSEGNGVSVVAATDTHRSTIFSTITDYIELFVIAISVVLILFSFVFRTCTVDGASMNNTLLNNEVLVISDLAYTPDREDVIVFHQTGNRNLPLVKRVIGIGGDTVTIDFNSWSVSIIDKNGNAVALSEEYVNIDENFPHGLSYSNGGIHTFVVPEGSLFVLGDNRNHSMDSTDSVNVGYVDERRVLGKVLFRVSPISKFGTIN